MKDKLSYSGLRNLMQCETKFKAYLKEEYQWEGSKDTLIGNLIHTGLDSKEALYEFVEDNHDILYKNKNAMYVDYERAFDTLNYAMLQVPETIRNNSEHEVHVEGYIFDAPFHGYIDGVREYNKEVYIYDYKTCANFDRVFDELAGSYKPWYYQHYRQLLIYAYLYAKQNDCFDKTFNLSVYGIKKKGASTPPNFQEATLTIDGWDIESKLVSLGLEELVERATYIMYNIDDTFDYCGECDYCISQGLVKRIKLNSYDI